MKQELIELIHNARRELRVDSGLPLTAEEQAEEDRKKQLDELMIFASRTFPPGLVFLLDQSTVWTAKGPAEEFVLEGHVFHLRKQEENVYVLFEINGPEEQEVFRASGKDSQFGNRVLVAMADRVLPSQ
jgi:hypothetical protein